MLNKKRYLCKTNIQVNINMCVSVQEGDHRMLNKKRYLCKTNIQVNINMCVSVQDHRMLNKKRYLCKTNIQVNINMCVSVQDVEEESTQDKKPGELTCVSLCRKESTEN